MLPPGFSNQVECWGMINLVPHFQAEQNGAYRKKWMVGNCLVWSVLFSKISGMWWGHLSFRLNIEMRGLSVSHGSVKHCTVESNSKSKVKRPELKHWLCFSGLLVRTLLLLVYCCCDRHNVMGSIMSCLA